MQPFQPGVVPPEAFDPEEILRRFGHLKSMTREQAEQTARRAFAGDLFLNDDYQVLKHVQAPNNGAGALLVHLSIKRRDKEPIQDGSALQEIKNLLVGPQFAAVEMFPHEDRLVDSANQYHLWSILDPAFPWPFDTALQADDVQDGDDEYETRLGKQVRDGHRRLSIRRRDGSRRRDWRRLQEWKNRCVGVGHEGIEVFPAEAALVRNGWWHLQVCTDPSFRLPFGFNGRLVLDAQEAEKTGGRQRPLA